MTPASGSVASEKVPVVRIVPMGEEDPVAVSKKDRFLLSTIVVLLIILAALAVLGFLVIKPGPDVVQGQGRPPRFVCRARCRAVWLIYMWRKVSRCARATRWCT